MNAKRRLGVVMPSLADPLDYQLLEGIFDVAKPLGYDVFIYTGIYNSHIDLQQDSYIHGLENIYRLPAKQKLDGILWAADLFHNQPVLEEIQGELLQSNIPCLVLGETLLPFENILPRQQESMYRITKHMIEVHRCKKIYCITGFEGNDASEERLAGYRQAMYESGLPIPANGIFYGGFWKDISEEIGRRIAAGGIPKPEAIVCASDIMAAALCRSLLENGVAVPDEIKITGYDGGWDSWLNQPRITTVEGRDRQYGADAMLMLHEMITGTVYGFSEHKQTLCYGESCGCDPARIPQATQAAVETYFRARVRNQAQKRTFLAADLFAQTGGAASLNDWIAKIDRVGHVLQNWLWLDVCLCEDWCMDFERPEQFRQTGFSDKMFLALSKRHGVNAKDQFAFDTYEILPALREPHEPMMILMTSLHAHGQVFGYLASAYCEPEDAEPDEYYTNWCDAAVHGLYQLQQALYSEYRRNQMSILSTHDPETGLYNKRGLAEHLHDILHCYKQSGKAPLLVTMSVAELHSTGYSGELLFANALRDTLPQNAFCARLQQKIFGLILPVEKEGSDEATAENHLHLIEHRMLHLTGKAVRQLPMIAMVRQRLQSESLAELLEIVEQAEQAIHEQVSAESGFYPDNKEQLYRLRNDIMTKPQLDWNIPDIAKAIGISRSYFQRLYRQQFSVSCWDDIINARIKKACQLLQYTDMRIQEIGIQCGYKNESHFMRQFKEKCGVTALQYRKEHKV